MCQCFLGDSSVSPYGTKIALRTELLLFWSKQQSKVLTSDRCHACERGGGVDALVCSLHNKCFRAFQLLGQRTHEVTFAVVGFVPLSDHLRIWKWVIKNFISF